MWIPEQKKEMCRCQQEFSGNYRFSIVVAHGQNKMTHHGADCGSQREVREKE